MTGDQLTCPAWNPCNGQLIEIDARTIRTSQKNMTGGKREGAGRPVSINPASKMITAKLTQEQHRRWVELGASRWLKRLLNEKDCTNIKTVL